MKTARFLILGATLLLAAAPPAAGRGDAFHLRLLRSEPKADTTVTVPPAAIRLWFSQEPELSTTTIGVIGPGELAIALGELRLERTAGNPVAADVQGTLTGGRYLVRWRTMSRDGHPVSGRFAFTIAAPTPTQ
jgi:methionine-rich copper-binding protein CopC